MTQYIPENREEVNRLKSRSSRSGIVLCAIFLSFYIALVISMGAVKFFDSVLSGASYDIRYAVATLISIILQYVFPLALGLVIMGINKESMFPKFVGTEYSMGKSLSYMPMAYVIPLIASLVNNVIFEFISKYTGFKGLENPVESAKTDTVASTVILVILTVVIAPVFEELIFRGVILSNLRRYGDKFAIVSSAIVFGIFHRNFHQFPYTLALGIVLGYITVRANSAKPAMVIHAIYNVLGISSLYLADNEVYEKMTQTGVQYMPTTGKEVSIFILMGLQSLIIIGLVIWGLVMLIVNIVKYCKRRTKGYDISYLSLGVLAVPEKTKYRIFFTRASMIVMLVIAIYEFAQSLFPEISIINLLYGV